MALFEQFDLKFGEQEFENRVDPNFSKVKLTEMQAIEELKLAGKENIATIVQKVLFLFNGKITISEINTLVRPNSIVTVDNYGEIVATINKIGAISTDMRDMAVLVVPEGVRELPSDFVTFNRALVGIVLPRSLERISERALIYSPNLRDVFISENTSFIGSTAFIGCSSLAAIMVSENNPYYKGEGYLTDKKGKKLIYVPESYMPSYSRYSDESDMSLFGPTFADDKITELGDYALYFSRFATVKLPLLKKIGSHAMENSGRLEHVISRPVIYLGESALRNCFALQEFDLSLVRSLPEYCFSSTRLTDVEFSTDLETIDDFCFAGCYLLKNISPIFAKHIGAGAFQCSKIWRADIRNALTIGDYCFNDCRFLSEVCIEGDIKTLSKGAFMNCKALESISLPASLQAIEDFVFADCTSLPHLTIPRNVRSISDFAFGEYERDGVLYGIGIPYYACDELAAIDVEEDNEYYKSVDGVLFDSAMERLLYYPPAKPKKSYCIPDSIRRISPLAFLGVQKLEEFIANNRVDEIGPYTFAFSSIKIIGIGAEVSSLDWLNYLDKLEGIMISAYNPHYRSIDSVVYSRDSKTLIKYPPCKQDNSYSVLSRTERIADYAFKNAKYVKSVALNDGLLSLGTACFMGCSSLRGITIPASVQSLDTESLGYSECDVPMYNFYIDATEGTAGDEYKKQFIEKRDLALYISEQTDCGECYEYDCEYDESDDEYDDFPF